MFNYNKKVMQIFKKPKHVGVIKNPDGYSKVGNLRCGDILEFFLKIKNNKIINAKYRTYGCIAAISASDALCELVIGKTIEEASKVTDKDIINYLGNLPAFKYHCSVLGKEGLTKAIENYKKNKT